MAVTVKTQICNMALSLLGNYGSVNDIDDPKSSKETVFALWYDDALKAALRLVIPNFALARRVVARLDYVAPFGYTYAYEYPADCVKVLGFGDIDAKDVGFSIEDGRILTDLTYESGLPLRYVKEVTDVNKFTADFKILFSMVLASYVCMEITQKISIKQYIDTMLPAKISELSGINAQENPPIRKSTSKFKQARYGTPQRNNEKR